MDEPRVLDAGRDLRNIAPVIGAVEPAEATARAGLGGRTAYGILALGLEKTVALGIALYLPRHLGLADYGRYAFLVSYLGFFQVLPDASLEAVLVARLARMRGDARQLAGGGALVRLATSLASGVVGLAVLAAVTGDVQLVEAGAIGAIGLAALAGTPYRVLLRARLRMSRYVALLAGQTALAIVLLGAAIHAGGGLIAVLATVSTAALAGVGVGRLLVGRGARLRLDPGLGHALFADAWPLAATTLTTLGAQQALQLLLLRLDGAAEVGLLGGAQKLVEAVGLLPQALMLSVLPALSLASARPGGAASVAREVARILVVVLVPVAAALALWAQPVLTGALGPSFGAAAPVLRILAPGAVLTATGVVLTNLLLAVGLQRALLRVMGASALAMVVLGAALVPRYGAAGVAAAGICSGLGGQVLLLCLRRTRAEARPVLAAVVHPLGLGALAAAGVALLGASLAPGVTLLLVGYPAALVATGAIRRADLLRWRGEGE